MPLGIRSLSMLGQYLVRLGTGLPTTLRARWQLHSCVQLHNRTKRQPSAQRGRGVKGERRLDISEGGPKQLLRRRLAHPDVGVSTWQQVSCGVAAPLRRRAHSGRLRAEMAAALKAHAQLTIGTNIMSANVGRG